jgi:serine protease Do
MAMAPSLRRRCFMARSMLRRSRTAAGVFAAFLSVTAPGFAAGPDNVADLVAPLLGAVVNISTSQTVAASRSVVPPPQLPDGSPFQDFFDEFFGEKGDQEGNRPRRVQSLGSGFVIDPSGIIATNNHVIEDADEITATFADGTKRIATVIGHDEKTDIALIQVKADKPLTAVSFGDSRTLRVGDWVMAIGNPFGLGGTVTVGIVSARNRDINAGPYDDFIQTDAAINRGNSGGPLFNEKGEVIGINTAIISPTGGSIGIGFAVPSEIAINIIDQLRQFGETHRGWLGVRIQDVTDDVARDLGMEVARGALVAGVDEKGPAAAAGIMAGDVVLSLDGQTINEHNALPRIVADQPVGKEVDVVVLRDGKQQTIRVTLGRLEDAERKIAEADKALGTGDEGADAAPPSTDGEPPATNDLPATVAGPLGLSLSDLTPQSRDRFGIKGDIAAGVVVASVAKGSAAERTRMEPGDVIVEIAGERVSTPDDVTAQIEKLKKDGSANAQMVVQSKEGHVRWVNLPLDD